MLRQRKADLERVRARRLALTVGTPEYELAYAEEVRIVQEVRRLEEATATDELTSMDAEGDDGQVFGG